MKFDALRSSVARLFETAATLVSPQTGALERSNAPLPQVAPNDLPKQGGPKHLDWLRENGKSLDAIANAKKAGLVAGKVTPDGFMPLPEPTIALGLERAPLTPAGLKSLINTKTEAEAKADEIERAIRDAMPGADVHVKVIGTGEDVTAKILQDIVEQAKREGIKPPPDEDFPWSTWAKIRDEHQIPRGWAFCRIANRFDKGSEAPDTCKFVFGIVRGSFGLWGKPYDVCSFDFEKGSIPDHEKTRRTLISVCHLPSGTNMGLFFDINLAAEACELMDKTHTDWSYLDKNNPAGWAQFFNQMVTIWSHVGIEPSISHAHNLNSDGPAITIFERTEETMAMWRPQVLS